jgi:hypothetical protein
MSQETQPLPNAARLHYLSYTAEGRFLLKYYQLWLQKCFQLMRVIAQVYETIACKEKNGFIAWF